MMKKPLALPGEGFQFVWVKLVFTLILCCLLSAPAWAQINTVPQARDRAPEVPAESQPDVPPLDEQDERDEQDEPSDEGRSRIIIEPGPSLINPTEPLPAPALPPSVIVPDVSGLPDPDQSIPEAPIPEADAPDYSRLSSNQERAARLDEMFARLGEAADADAGNLVAEEIWSVWLNSGSPSVNLLLRRGAEAQTRGQNTRARAMYDYVTTLSPDYAEGWARSSRLALEEREFARATSEAVRALTLEPRHFYAMWTLGNVLERLGRQDDALEAYREANRLYPTLESVKERVDALDTMLGGSVL